MKTFPLKLLVVVWLGVSSTAEASNAIYNKTLQSIAIIQTRDGTGTGCIVDGDKKRMVTCAHVVGSEREVEVYFPMYRDGKLVTVRKHYKNARPVLGRVLLVDMRRDLALIELESLPEGSAALSLATGSVGPGTDLHAVGCPGAGSGLWTYSFGKARQVLRHQWTIGGFHNANLVESMLPVSPGDSGGPVVNDQGELVGITSWGKRHESLFSYAIDVLEVRDFLDKADTTIKLNAEIRKAAALVEDEFFEAAIVVLQNALKRDRNNPDLLLELAKVYIELGQYDEAEKTCSKILKIDENEYSAWKVRGYAQMMNEDYEAAKASLLKALDLNITDGQTFDYLADCFEAMGDSKAADRVREAKKNFAG